MLTNPLISLLVVGLAAIVLVATATESNFVGSLAIFGIVVILLPIAKALR